MDINDYFDFTFHLKKKYLGLPTNAVCKPSFRNN